MKRGYDFLAPYYDTLVKLMYGDAIHNAQAKYLSLIPPFSTILIAGGGTGWILEEITRIHSQGLYIDYIDASAKMIAKAKTRTVGKNEVSFICQSLLNWQADINYDIIITPFFFDNFSEASTQKIFMLLHSALKTNGLWLNTDFQIITENAHLQKLLLFVMYTFFRLAANIEAKQLPDLPSRFRLHNYKRLQEQTFFRQFIIASVYKKLIPQH